MLLLPNTPFTLKSSGDQGQAPLDRIATILRRNAKLLAVCAVLVPAVALIYSLTQAKEYTASATLLFRDPGLDEKLFGTALFNQDDDPQRTAATNLQLVSLRQVSERTAVELKSTGLTADEIQSKVSVEPVGESDLIAVDAVDGEPKLAAELANAFAANYIAFRRDADRAKITEAQNLVQQELDALSEVERAGTEGQQLGQNARELEILASLQTGNAELVQPAQAPSDPSAPKTLRNVILGLLLGLMLGAALTLLREQLDRRLKDAGEAAAVFGLPVLATIPESRTISHMGRGESVSSAGVESDAFRMLRTNLRYFNVDRPVKSIVVTSAAPQDGKTTVSWNLALAEARAGKRVLYIEADLRRPSLGGQLGLTTKSGLSFVLAGMVDVQTALQSVEGIDLLLAGPLPPNPAELIESERMTALVRWGEEHYDRVIIDTPPAAVVSDAIPLVTSVSGVVIVVRIERSRRDAADQLREQLTNLGAPVLGLVVNGATARGTYYYGPAGVERVFEDTSRKVRRDGSSPATKGQRRRKQQNGQQPPQQKRKQQRQPPRQKQQAQKQPSQPTQSQPTQQSEPQKQEPQQKQQPQRP
jgi:capsular exopolysaccharide synthesis family protein